MLENILSWVLVLLIFLLGGTFCYRIYLSIRLTSEEKVEETTSGHLRKIRRIKKKNQEKNIQILLWSGIGMVIVNLVVMYIFIGNQEKIGDISQENIKLKEAIQQLKLEQTQWIQASGFVVYPEEGIKLNKDLWVKVDKDDSRKSLEEIEQSLASQLQPYIGLNTILINSEESKDQLKMTIRSEDNPELKEQLNQTVKGIVKTLNDIAPLKEVTFQFMGTDEQVSTSYLYQREKENQSLEIHEAVNEKPKE